MLMMGTRRDNPRIILFVGIVALLIKMMVEDRKRDRPESAECEMRSLSRQRHDEISENSRRPWAGIRSVRGSVIYGSVLSGIGLVMAVIALISILLTPSTAERGFAIAFIGLIPAASGMMVLGAIIPDIKRCAGKIVAAGLGAAGVLAIVSLAVISISLTEHLTSQRADRLARSERSHLHELAHDQQNYHRQNGEYAQTLSSLRLIDPKIGAWKHQDQWKLGATDGHGFFLSFDGAGDGKKISYSLQYGSGHYETTCEAPAHTGCIDGHWKWFADDRAG